VAISDRIWEGLKATIRLNDRVDGLASQMKAMSGDLRDIDRRLIKVETTIELATRGGFKLHGPRSTAIEDK